MTEQVANRHVSADGRVRQVRRERRVEVDEAFVDELHHDRGDERLGETANAEHGIRRHRFAGGVGDSRGRRGGRAVPDHEDGDAAIVVADEGGGRGVEVEGRLGRGRRRPTVVRR